MELQQMETAILVQMYEQANNDGTVKTALENEILSRRQTPNKYSKDDLFHKNKTLNKALTVYLFPNSPAYNIIGNNVTIDMELTDEELLNFLRNLSLNPPLKTYGLFKVKVLSKNSFSVEQVENLESLGIDTSEIYDVQTY